MTYLHPVLTGNYPDTGLGKQTLRLVDAFVYNLGSKLIDLFPTFSLIANCLQKMALDAVEDALLVVPLWPTQPWFSQLAEMLVDHPRLSPNNILSYYIPGARKETVKPLKVQLIACHCSGSQLRTRTFREMLASLIIDSW